MISLSKCAIEFAGTTELTWFEDRRGIHGSLDLMLFDDSHGMIKVDFYLPSNCIASSSP